jgi:cell wall-associated NlpC family hydrolase
MSFKREYRNTSLDKGTMMDARSTFVNAVRQRIGLPYIWGCKDGNPGYDCSGLVTDCLKIAGVNVGDHSASEIAKLFSGYRVVPSLAQPGALYFYGVKKDTITHVMIVLARWSNNTIVLAGVRGGDSSVLNVHTAFTKNAFVDTVLCTYWTTALQLAVDPFMNANIKP